MFIRLPPKGPLELSPRPLELGAHGVGVTPGGSARAKSPLGEQVATRDGETQRDRTQDESVEDGQNHESLNVAKPCSDRQPAVIQTPPKRLCLGLRHYAARPRVVPNRASRTSTIRRAAPPSQPSGIPPRLPAPFKIFRTSARIVPGSDPTTMFVPWVTVTGRSVLSRSVRQGIPSTVVSS